VKRGVVSHRRHKDVLRQAKGLRGTRSRLYKRANEAVLRALQVAYRDRRNRTRAMLRLWSPRINAARRLHGLPYDTFGHGLTVGGVKVDREMLADIAVRDSEGFAAFVEVAKNATAA